jgi:hypothetical protein
VLDRDALFEVLLVGLEQRQATDAAAVEFAHHIAEGVERQVGHDRLIRLQSLLQRFGGFRRSRRA